MEPSTTTLPTFDAIYDHLTSTYGFPLLASESPYAHDASLSHPISDLFVHPTLESILHLLNADLASAHFLVRHMQNHPANEGMYIHGLLHRIEEGDYENTKLWNKEVVDSDCFKYIWGEKDNRLKAANEFVDNARALKKGEGDQQMSTGQLQAESEREIKALTEFCKEKFGTGQVNDAKEAGAWVDTSDEHKAVTANMVVGGEGWRQF